jgi:hypothetical protein
MLSADDSRLFLDQRDGRGQTQVVIAGLAPAIHSPDCATISLDRAEDAPVILGFQTGPVPQTVTRLEMPSDDLFPNRDR